MAEDYPAIRSQALDILQEEAKLEEIVKLVGMESLSNRENLFSLSQNPFVKTFSSKMLLIQKMRIQRQKNSMVF